MEKSEEEKSHLMLKKRKIALKSSRNGSIIINNE